jgi:hypothetical protein
MKQVKHTYIVVQDGVQCILFELYNGSFYLCGTAVPVTKEEANKLLA